MKTNQEKDNSSSHILVTSSNMLGLCFIVITTLAALKLNNTTLIDEFTGVAILLFFTSCVLSFLSVRGKVSKNKRYEMIADYIFLSGILTIFITVILLVTDLIQ